MKMLPTDNGVCMYSLFTQNFEVAATARDVYIAPAQSTVQQISTPSFITRSWSGNISIPQLQFYLTGELKLLLSRVPTSCRFHLHKYQYVPPPNSSAALAAVAR